MAEGQLPHLGILVFMLAGAAWWLQGAAPARSFLGLTGLGWVWVSIWGAVLHQIIVAVVFRGQLHRALFSRLFGDKDLRIWGLIFFPFLIARPVTVLIIAVLDAGSLPLWQPLAIALGVALFLPAAYTMYSVRRYFSFARALGGDHFRDEYLTMPMVTQGAFRWSGNAMYTFGFLGLWAFALLFGSKLALIVAAFQHAYIWVHMYTVEGPDLRHLFGPADPIRQNPT